MLNASYFNNLELDVYYDKYYDADEVDEILVDIRAQAEQMGREILSLREEVSRYEREKDDVRRSVEEAKRTCQEIIGRANAEAEQIRSSALSSVSQCRGDEFYIKKVEHFYDSVRKQYEESASDLNSKWQEFLVSLSEPDSDDLKLKVAGIASAIDEIEKSTL